MNIEKAIAEAGYSLPSLPAAGDNYVPVRTVGKMVYLSGVISTNGNGVITGRAGDGSGAEEGYAAAQTCALIHLAVLRSTWGHWIW